MHLARLRITVLLLSLALGLAGCERKGCGTTGTTPGKATLGVKLPFPTARALYITNNGSDSVSAIDRDGDAVVTAPVDVDPARREAPHHLALDLAHDRVLVALSFPADPGKKRDPHAAHGTSADHGLLAELSASTLSAKVVANLDENPGEIVLTRDKKRIIVTHYDMARAMNVAAKGGASPATMFARILVFDATTYTLLGQRPICVAPHGAITSIDDSTAIVACYGSDEITFVDLTKPELPTSRFTLGALQGVPGVPRYGPYSVAISPNGKTLLVANLESSDVRTFDMTKRVFAPSELPTHARPFLPTFISDDVALVPLQAPDGLTAIDVTTHRMLQRVDFAKDQCELPHAVRITPDRRAFVVCEGNHHDPGAVVEVDIGTLGIKKRWVVGVYPDGIDL